MYFFSFLSAGTKIPEVDVVGFQNFATCKITNYRNIVKQNCQRCQNLNFMDLTCIKMHNVHCTLHTGNNNSVLLTSKRAVIEHEVCISEFGTDTQAERQQTRLGAEFLQN